MRTVTAAVRAAASSKGVRNRKDRMSFRFLTPFHVLCAYGLQDAAKSSSVAFS
jgi:hypothetical protein